jgi:predicted nucleotidyltransferase
MAEMERMWSADAKKNELEKILKDFVKGAKNIFGENLKDVILFGSYALDEYDAESDVDIAVIANILREEESSYIDEITNLLDTVDKKHHYSVLLSPIVLSNSFYEEWQDTIPFYKHVKNVGVSIHA